MPGLAGRGPAGGPVRWCRSRGGPAAGAGAGGCGPAMRAGGGRTRADWRRAALRAGAMRAPGADGGGRSRRWPGGSAAPGCRPALARVAALPGPGCVADGARVRACLPASVGGARVLGRPWRVLAGPGGGVGDRWRGGGSVARGRQGASALVETWSALGGDLAALVRGLPRSCGWGGDAGGGSPTLCARGRHRVGPRGKGGRQWTGYRQGRARARRASASRWIS